MGWRQLPVRMEFRRQHGCGLTVAVDILCVVNRDEGKKEEGGQRTKAGTWE